MSVYLGACTVKIVENIVQEYKWCSGDICMWGYNNKSSYYELQMQ